MENRIRKLIGTALLASVTICGGASAETSAGYEADAILDGNYRQAEIRLQGILQTSPDDAFALLNLAAIYDRSGRTEEARGLYERVMALRDNPYAQVADRKVKPVKTVASNALKSLNARP